MTLPLSSAEGRAAFHRLAKAPRPVLFLDVDGTLAPLVERPESARAPAHTRRLLEALRRRGAGVVLVSGRAARDAHRVVGAELDGILGNHGAELLRQARVARWTRHDRSATRAVVEALAPALTLPWPDIRLESKGYSIALHHRLPPGELNRLMRVVRAALLDDEFVALRGRRVIDVRARGADKGGAVLRWLKQRERGKVPLKDVLYAGDDTTDEDAFRALGRRAVTIAVGPRPKGARFRTRDPMALARWLHRLERARR